jgi:S-adenosylmethionine:tRNA ribosyltransferase-isomerase
MTRTDEFLYDLPEGAIAQTALEPRHAARLLHSGTLADHVVADLPLLLDRGDLVVVNSTRVRAARLRGTRRTTGGAVEALLLGEVEPGVWEALCRPSRRLRPGVELDFGPIHAEVRTEPEDGIVRLRLQSEEGPIEDLLPVVGSVPLPPYFHGTLADPERYQTMFAKTVGSAAAPTAGLHFTRELLSNLAASGVDVAEIELEVGLDTFRPIGVDRVEDHHMHSERYRIPAATSESVAAARSRGNRIVAIGTTVVRTLESAAAGDGSIAPGSGTTRLFVVPGYRFKIVDAVLTNFHAPGTTLVVLVAAMLGERWRVVYDAALARGYRFLSFGDAMFIDGIREP